MAQYLSAFTSASYISYTGPLVGPHKALSWLTGAMLMVVAACGGPGIRPDASGTFESEEVIVSAEAGGRILSFEVHEGDRLMEDSAVGSIDVTNIRLQKEQVQASLAALSEKTADVAPQVKLLEQELAVRQSQLNTWLKEAERTKNLIKQGAATGKQLDDVNAQIDLLQKQMSVARQQIKVQQSNTRTQNRAILSEAGPLEKKIAELDERLQKALIVNPVTGTVLAKYAEAGEVVTPGKALYKIADLSVLYLRAYITGDLLPQARLGQEVSVLVDSTSNSYRRYRGKITWISDKAEFTPKTIQTKEERANLVYALKVRVENDGYLKIGMYGEILLNDQQ